MLKTIILTAIYLSLPENAFAWGPMTHAYLAGEVLKLGSLLPPEVWLIIGNFRQDFLYGNLMADMIIGKRYLPKDKQIHDWDFALRLMQKANTPSEKSFMYGFLSHLAADTVAHQTLTRQKVDIHHTWIEFMADRAIDNACRMRSVTIKKAVQNRNDRFLKESLSGFVFSFNTHKRIFKGVVLLSALVKKGLVQIDRSYLERLHNESLIRMLNVLLNGKDSPVLAISPSPKDA
jgi:hypothetical protein